MLKANVGYSTNPDSYTAGKTTVENALKSLTGAKIGFLYTSVKNDIKEVIKGVKKITDNNTGIISAPLTTFTSISGLSKVQPLYRPCEQEILIKKK